MLGSCALPHFTARYIQRHNTSVRLIYDAIFSGQSGGMFCLMDAGTRDNLEPGVSGTRLPAWMLPDVPPAQRRLFRPDLLLIPGLSHEHLSLLRSAATPAHVRAVARDVVNLIGRKRGRTTVAPAGLAIPLLTTVAPAGLHVPLLTTPTPAGLEVPPLTTAAPAGLDVPPLTPAAPSGQDVPPPAPTAPTGLHVPTPSIPFRVPAVLRQHCTVYIVEFSHCNDNNSSERYSAKLSQHNELKLALEKAGWIVEVVVLLVGSAGTVFHPILAFLTDSMHVPHSIAHTCLARLHLHAVRSCHSIICDRRQLERRQTVPNPNHTTPP